VSDHKDAVKAFEKAANEATDPEVKAFASKTLPTLKHHLSMAEALQQKLGK
jgi:putative membrane protein